MVKDAEANAAADKEKLETIELRNNADSMISSTENLRSMEVKFLKKIKKRLKNLEELKKALKDEKISNKDLKEN